MNNNCIKIKKGVIEMKASNAIEVRNMYKSFKLQYDKPTTLKERLVFWTKGDKEYHEVLKNINIDIKKGETVALIGTNGSGKSTLLKLMTKIIYPNKGTIETSGKLTSLLELGAGFHPDFTGRENIYFNAAIFGLTKKEIEKRIDEIIEFSELGDFIDNPIRTYSSGMYMRLAFSIAINVDAEILLIDEILAVGDQHFQDKCFAKLEELKNSDKTIVIVSHSLDVVKKLCNRAIWIYKGEFKLDGDPIYVIDEYLKQVAIDHKEEKKKAVEKGIDKYHGTIYIDSPKDFVHISLKNPNFEIKGWEISDCDKSIFELKVGNKIINSIERVARLDVLEAYAEQYGGFADGDEIGWKTNCNINEYVQYIQDGELTVTASLYDSNGNEIGRKDLTIYIDEE